jgi:hypothetical protein
MLMIDFADAPTIPVGFLDPALIMTSPHSSVTVSWLDTGCWFGLPYTVPACQRWAALQAWSRGRAAMEKVMAVSCRVQ